MFLDMLYYLLLEQLVVDARALCCAGPQSSCYYGPNLSFEIEEEMRRDLMEDILWCCYAGDGQGDGPPQGVWLCQVQ